MLLSMSKKWNNMYGGKNESKRMLPFVLFNAGRLASFVVLGGVVGAIGADDFEIEIAGVRYPALASLKPLYDPSNARIKI